MRTAASWAIWRLPYGAVILILGVDLSALAIPIIAHGAIELSDVSTAAFLVSLSMAYSVITRRWERARRALYLGAEPAGYQNLLSVWSFAAAVTLPLGLAALVMVLVALGQWPARDIAGEARSYRYVYSSAGSVLAVAAANYCAAIPLRYQLGLLIAVPVYTLVGIATIGVAMLSVGEASRLRILVHPSAHRIELCSIMIALGEAQLIHAGLAMFAWLSLPAGFLLQRWVLRADLQAADDPTAPPMREQAWLVVAREVIAACPVAAILRIDTADPATVSYLARIQVGCDAIGHVGRAGLAVLLPDCPGTNADAIALRMRTALLRQAITANVAVAAKPRDGQSLNDLLAVSEAELITRAAASSQSSKAAGPN